MPSPVLEVRGADLRIQAFPNGRAAVSVEAWQVSTDVLLHQDSINPARERERLRYCDALPVALQEPARGLLTELGCAMERERAEHPMRPDTDAPTPITPWPEAVSGARLLDDLVAFLERRVVLPPHAADTLALWTLHTWGHKLAFYTPYIWVSSPVRECGKSTLLDVLTVLVCSGKKADAMSAAAMRRYIEKARPTLLLDELDTQLRREGAEELRNVLNSGFARNGTAIICDGDQHEVKEFRVYCPKVLAGIGRLWDTVASRAIPIRLRKALPPELATLVRVRGDRLEEQGEPHRRRCLRWIQDHTEDLTAADPHPPTELGARAADIWRPLLAIAQVAGGGWWERAQRAAVGLHADTEESDLGLLLLEDLRGVFRRLGKARLHTAVLLRELGTLEERPWPEYSHGKPLTPKGLAGLLARFSIKPAKAPWREEGDLARGYEVDVFEASWTRYLGDPLQGPSVTVSDPSSEAIPPSRLATVGSEAPVPAVTDATDTGGAIGQLLFEGDL